MVHSGAGTESHSIHGTARQKLIDGGTGTSRHLRRACGHLEAVLPARATGGPTPAETTMFGACETETGRAYMGSALVVHAHQRNTIVLMPEDHITAPCSFRSPPAGLRPLPPGYS
jgi:hypothetical protein